MTELQLRRICCLVIRWGKEHFLKRFIEFNRLPSHELTCEIGTIDLSQVHAFNFDIRSNCNTPYHEVVDNLYDLILEGTRIRTNAESTNIVSLSGGLDSRIVGAALHDLNIPFHGATFLDANKMANLDAVIAELQSNWRKFLAFPGNSTN